MAGFTGLKPGANPRPGRYLCRIVRNEIAMPSSVRSGRNADVAPGYFPKTKKRGELSPAAPLRLGVKFYPPICFW